MRECSKMLLAFRMTLKRQHLVGLKTGQDVLLGRIGDSISTPVNPCMGLQAVLTRSAILIWRYSPTCTRC